MKARPLLARPEVAATVLAGHDRSTYSTGGRFQAEPTTSKASGCHASTVSQLAGRVAIPQEAGYGGDRTILARPRRADLPSCTALHRLAHLAALEQGTSTLLVVFHVSPGRRPKEESRRGAGTSQPASYSHPTSTKRSKRRRVPRIDAVPRTLARRHYPTVEGTGVAQRASEAP